MLCSEETRVKIGAGVRKGWQRRREMLMVQEKCLFEWQNVIAEASRKGYASEAELQWDSYKIIAEQLQQEWLESIEKRKSMPRPKGSKRAPKSPEQRRKISQAISAKWADPVSCTLNLKSSLWFWFTLLKLSFRFIHTFFPC